MASNCNSTSNEIVQSPSTSATTTRSVGLRSLFSSCRNCFDCCSSFQSNAMPSTSTAHALKEIRPSPFDTPPSKLIEPEIEDTNAFERITSSLSEKIEPSTSTVEQIEAEDEHSNAFEGITSSPFEKIEPSAFEQIEAKNEQSNAFEGIIPSASTSNRPSTQQKKLPYDVFINHRGPDVKRTLAASLYKTLTGMGLRVFLDKEELELGDFLPGEIQEAIQSASLHIAIFSQNYAESPWCLAELAFMLKTGTQIVPVFYRVETDVVRYAKGVYAEAFSRHEEKGRYTSKLLGEWKNALNNVCYNFGDIVRNEDAEGRLLKNIVNRVLKEIKIVPFEIAKYPVGLDEAFEDFERTTIQSAESHHNVQIVGIWGMGGSGKTTLAKHIYNNKCVIMDKSSFLLDIRDAASTSKLHKKQQKLVEDLGLEGIAIENIEEGKGILSSRLQSIRVLIILDDVDNIDQLDALVPTRGMLGRGSLIVVTSREFEVLRSWGILSIYKIKVLSPIHAKQLFCWYAFLQSSPQQGFEDLVENFLNVCDGLPLSLKVFGAQLYGICDKNYWRTQLQKISRILPKAIIERLKISYDALDDEEKQVFLDIACFFVGERKTSAIAAWDGCGWNGLHSWEQLLNKCLVEDSGDFIRMHDHLRDLGRAIATEQSPYRLWSPQQVINVDNVMQPIALRGIMSITTESTSENEFLESSLSQRGKLIVNTNRGPYTLQPSSLGLKILHVQRNWCDQVIGELSRELVWLRWHDIGHSNLQSLKSLKNLRFLELTESFNVKRCLKELWKTEKNAPVQLRELVIYGCSEFQRFPKSIGSLKHLKKIDLSGSSKLSSLPEEFCLLTSLEHLNLNKTALSSLPSSFGDLTNLKHLDLFSSWDLSSLPCSFGDLRNLEHLGLSDSWNLSSLPNSFGDLRNLRYLALSRCANLSSLPNSFGDLRNLRHLALFRCANLSSLPNSFGDLRNLRYLSLSCCANLSSLPNSFGDLRNLRYLDLSYNMNLGTLPVSFKQLRFLQHLELNGCSKLTLEPDILESMVKLEYLNISGCDQSEELPRHITNQPFLRELYCVIKRLMKVPVNIGQLRKLESIMIGGELLTSLPTSMGDLSSLTSLTISSCAQLQCLPDSLRSLNLLRDLDIHDLGVQSLPNSVEQLVNLQRLRISNCPISELDLGVSSFTSLTSIRLRATKVSKISVSCPVLETLYLCNNANLSLIQVLPNSLKNIHLEENPKLEALPSFAQSAFLREFELRGCDRVKKIHGLENCTALENVIIHTRLFAGVESSERMERLRRVEFKADSITVVEGYIQRMQKWPREQIIVWAQAASDASSLVKSIVFPSLSVIDSFAKRKIKSNPSLKWPSTARCILLCYVVNSESPETSLQLGGQFRCKTNFCIYHSMKWGMGKWVWTGLFTQLSFIHGYMSTHGERWLHIWDIKGVSKGEVDGVLMTGEEEQVKKAFSHLWTSVM